MLVPAPPSLGCGFRGGAGTPSADPLLWHSAWHMALFPRYPRAMRRHPHRSHLHSPSQAALPLLSMSPHPRHQQWLWYFCSHLVNTPVLVPCCGISIFPCAGHYRQLEDLVYRRPWLNTKNAQASPFPLNLSVWADPGLFRSL